MGDTHEADSRLQILKEPPAANPGWPLGTDSTMHEYGVFDLNNNVSIAGLGDPQFAGGTVGGAMPSSLHKK